METLEPTISRLNDIKINTYVYKKRLHINIKRNRKFGLTKKNIYIYMKTCNYVLCIFLYVGPGSNFPLEKRITKNKIK